MVNLDKDIIDTIKKISDSIVDTPFEINNVSRQRMEDRIIGRQHRIHFSTSAGRILCGIKKWKCSDDDPKNVECKVCIRKLKEQEPKGCGVYLGDQAVHCGEEPNPFINLCDNCKNKEQEQDKE